MLKFLLSSEFTGERVSDGGPVVLVEQHTNFVLSKAIHPTASESLILTEQPILFMKLNLMTS